VFGEGGLWVHPRELADLFFANIELARNQLARAAASSITVWNDLADDMRNNSDQRRA